MTADIGSRVYGYSDEPREAQRGDLVTRDLLGGGSTTETTRSTMELDLDLRVPSGWERRLDLLSGEMYLKKSNPDPIHDLNLPPPPPAAAVDLKLLLSSAPSATPPPFDHQCTLEKVKSALERAGRRGTSRGSWRSTDGSPSSPSSSSSTSSSKRRTEETAAAAIDGSKDLSGSLTAAGCSKCLMYVLISSRDPRCPRCGSYVGVVPSATKKKQRREPMNMLDVNLNSTANGANF